LKENRFKLSFESRRPSVRNFSNMMWETGPQFVYWIIFFWHWQYCSVWKYHSY